MLEAFALLVLAAGSILGAPGPAPLSLAATGASFGFRPGMPYLVGLVLAIGIDCVVVAAGLAQIVGRVWWLTAGLFVFSAVYILTIAWKIASAPVGRTNEAEALPSFRDGLILNLTNPKAYAAIAAVYGGFALPVEPALLRLSLMGMATVAVAIFVDTLWLAGGSVLSRLLGHPRFARPIRIGFAAAMLIAVGLSAAASVRGT